MPTKKRKKLSHVAVKKYQTNPEIENINYGIRQRQAQSQKPLELLWIEIIITQSITKQNKNHEVHMNFDVLCVEHTEGQWLHIGQFLGGLKRKKYFKSWQNACAPTMPDIPNTEYIISEPDIKKLKKYRASLIKKTGYNSLPINKKQKYGKISITIDLDGKGIYLTDDSNKKYSIRSGTKRSKIIDALLKDKQSANNLKIFCDYKNDQALSKEIKKINDLFKKKLRLSVELIKGVETGGYILNKEDFKVK